MGAFHQQSTTRRLKARRVNKQTRRRYTGRFNANIKPPQNHSNHLDQNNPQNLQNRHQTQCSPKPTPKPSTTSPTSPTSTTSTRSHNTTHSRRYSHHQSKPPINPNPHTRTHIPTHHTHTHHTPPPNIRPLSTSHPVQQRLQQHHPHPLNSPITQSNIHNLLPSVTPTTTSWNTPMPQEKPLDPTSRSRLPRFPLTRNQHRFEAYKAPAYRSVKPHRPIIIDLARSRFTIRSVKCYNRLKTARSNEPHYTSNSFSVWVSSPVFQGDPLQLRRAVSIELPSRGNSHPSFPSHEGNGSVLLRLRYTVRMHNYIADRVVGANVVLRTRIAKILAFKASERLRIQRKINAAFVRVLPQTLSPLIFCDIMVSPTISVLFQPQEALEAEVRACIETLLQQSRDDSRYTIGKVIVNKNDGPAHDEHGNYIKNNDEKNQPKGKKGDEILTVDEFISEKNKIITNIDKEHKDINKNDKKGNLSSNIAITKTFEDFSENNYGLQNANDLPDLKTLPQTLSNALEQPSTIPESSVHTQNPALVDLNDDSYTIFNPHTILPNYDPNTHGVVEKNIATSLLASPASVAPPVSNQKDAVFVDFGGYEVSEPKHKTNKLHIRYSQMRGFWYDFFDGITDVSYENELFSEQNWDEKNSLQNLEFMKSRIEYENDLHSAGFSGSPDHVHNLNNAAVMKNLVPRLYESPHSQIESNYFGNKTMKAPLFHVHPLWIDTSDSAPDVSFSDVVRKNQLGDGIEPKEVVHVKKVKKDDKIGIEPEILNSPPKHHPDPNHHYISPRISHHLVHDGPVIAVAHQTTSSLAPLNILPGTAPPISNDPRSPHYAFSFQLKSALLTMYRNMSAEAQKPISAALSSLFDWNIFSTVTSAPNILSQSLAVSDCYTTETSAQPIRTGMTAVIDSRIKSFGVARTKKVIARNPLLPLPLHCTKLASQQAQLDAPAGTFPLFYQRYASWKLLAFEERNRNALLLQAHDGNVPYSVLDQHGNVIQDSQYNNWATRDSAGVEKGEKIHPFQRYRQLPILPNQVRKRLKMIAKDEILAPIETKYQHLLPEKISNGENEHFDDIDIQQTDYAWKQISENDDVDAKKSKKSGKRDGDGDNNNNKLEINHDDRDLSDEKDSKTMVSTIYPYPDHIPLPIDALYPEENDNKNLKKQSQYTPKLSDLLLTNLHTDTLTNNTNDGLQLPPIIAIERGFLGNFHSNLKFPTDDKNKPKDDKIYTIVNPPKNRNAQLLPLSDESNNKNDQKNFTKIEKALNFLDFSTRIGMLRQENIVSEFLQHDSVFKTWRTQRSYASHEVYFTPSPNRDTSLPNGYGMFIPDHDMVDLRFDQQTKLYIPYITRKRYAQKHWITLLSDGMNIKNFYKNLKIQKSVPVSSFSVPKTNESLQFDLDLLKNYYGMIRKSTKIMGLNDFIQISLNNIDINSGMQFALEFKHNHGGKSGGKNGDNFDQKNKFNGVKYSSSQTIISEHYVPMVFMPTDKPFLLSSTIDQNNIVDIRKIDQNSDTNPDTNPDPDSLSNPLSTLYSTHRTLHNDFSREFLEQLTGTIQSSLENSKFHKKNIFQNHSLNVSVPKMLEHQIYHGKVLSTMIALSTLISPVPKELHFDCYNPLEVKGPDGGDHFDNSEQNIEKNVGKDNKKRCYVQPQTTIVDLHQWYTEQMNDEGFSSTTNNYYDPIHQSIITPKNFIPKNNNLQNPTKPHPHHPRRAPWVSTMFESPQPNEILFSQDNLLNNKMLQMASKYYISPENRAFFCNILPIFDQTLDISPENSPLLLNSIINGDFNGEDSQRDGNGPQKDQNMEKNEKFEQTNQSKPVNLTHLFFARYQLVLDQALNKIRAEYYDFYNTAQNASQNSETSSPVEKVSQNDENYKDYVFLDQLPLYIAQSTMDCIQSLVWTIQQYKLNQAKSSLKISSSLIILRSLYASLITTLTGYEKEATAKALKANETLVETQQFLFFMQTELHKLQEEYGVFDGGRDGEGDGEGDGGNEKKHNWGGKNLGDTSIGMTTNGMADWIVDNSIKMSSGNGGGFEKDDKNGEKNQNDQKNNNILVKKHLTREERQRELMAKFNHRVWLKQQEVFSELQPANLTNTRLIKSKKNDQKSDQNDDVEYESFHNKYTIESQQDIEYFLADVYKDLLSSSPLFSKPKSQKNDKNNQKNDKNKQKNDKNDKNDNRTPRKEPRAVYITPPELLKAGEYDEPYPFNHKIGQPKEGILHNDSKNDDSKNPPQTPPPPPPQPLLTLPNKINQLQLTPELQLGIINDFATKRIPFAQNPQNTLTNVTPSLTSTSNPAHSYFNSPLTQVIDPFISSLTQSLYDWTLRRINHNAVRKHQKFFFQLVRHKSAQWEYYETRYQKNIADMAAMEKKVKQVRWQVMNPVKAMERIRVGKMAGDGGVFKGEFNEVGKFEFVQEEIDFFKEKIQKRLERFEKELVELNNKKEHLERISVINSGICVPELAELEQFHRDLQAIDKLNHQIKKEQHFLDQKNQNLDQNNDNYSSPLITPTIKLDKTASPRPKQPPIPKTTRGHSSLRKKNANIENVILEKMENFEHSKNPTKTPTKTPTPVQYPLTFVPSLSQTYTDITNFPPEHQLIDEISNFDPIRSTFTPKPITVPNIFTIYDRNAQLSRLMKAKNSYNLLYNHDASHPFPTLGVVEELPGQHANDSDLPLRNGIVQQTPNYTSKQTLFDRQFVQYARRIGESSEETAVRVAWERDFMLKYPHIHFEDGILINLDRELPPIHSLIDYTPLYQTLEQLEQIGNELVGNKYLNDVAMQFTLTPKEKTRLKLYLTRLIGFGGAGVSTGSSGKRVHVVEVRNKNLPQRNIYDENYENVLRNYYEKDDAQNGDNFGNNFHQNPLENFNKNNPTKKTSYYHRTETDPFQYQNLGNFSGRFTIPIHHGNRFVTPYTILGRKSKHFFNRLLNSYQQPSLSDTHHKKLPHALMYHHAKQHRSADGRSELLGWLKKEKSFKNSYLFRMKKTLNTIKQLGLSPEFFKFSTSNLINFSREIGGKTEPSDDSNGQHDGSRIRLNHTIKITGKKRNEFFLPQETHAKLLSLIKKRKSLFSTRSSTVTTLYYRRVLQETTNTRRKAIQKAQMEGKYVKVNVSGGNDDQNNDQNFEKSPNLSYALNITTPSYETFNALYNIDRDVYQTLHKELKKTKKSTVLSTKMSKKMSKNDQNNFDLTNNSKNLANVNLFQKTTINRSSLNTVPTYHGKELKTSDPRSNIGVGLGVSVGSEYRRAKVSAENSELKSEGKSEDKSEENKKNRFFENDDDDDDEDIIPLQRIHNTISILEPLTRNSEYLPDGMSIDRKSGNNLTQNINKNQNKNQNNQNIFIKSSKSQRRQFNKLWVLPLSNRVSTTTNVLLTPAIRIDPDGVNKRFNYDGETNDGNNFGNKSDHKNQKNQKNQKNSNKNVEQLLPNHQPATLNTVYDIFHSLHLATEYPSLPQDIQTDESYKKILKNSQKNLNPIKMLNKNKEGLLYSDYNFINNDEKIRRMLSFYPNKKPLYNQVLEMNMVNNTTFADAYMNASSQADSFNTGGNNDYFVNDKNNKKNGIKNKCEEKHNTSIRYPLYTSYDSNKLVQFRRIRTGLDDIVGELLQAIVDEKNDFDNEQNGQINDDKNLEIYNNLTRQKAPLTKIFAKNIHNGLSREESDQLSLLMRKERLLNEIFNPVVDLNQYDLPPSWIHSINLNKNNKNYQNFNNFNYDDKSDENYSDFENVDNVGHFSDDIDDIDGEIDTQSEDYSDPYLQSAWNSKKALKRTVIQRPNLISREEKLDQKLNQQNFEQHNELQNELRDDLYDLAQKYGYSLPHYNNHSVNGNWDGYKNEHNKLFLNETNQDSKNQNPKNQLFLHKPQPPRGNYKYTTGKMISGQRPPISYQFDINPHDEYGNRVFTKVAMEVSGSPSPVLNEMMRKMIHVLLNNHNIIPFVNIAPMFKRLMMQDRLDKF